MKIRVFATATCIAVLVTATGCGSTTDQPASKAKKSFSASPTPSPTGPRTFGTVEDLRDAAMKAGYSCSAWNQDDTVTLAAESGNCSDDDVISTYATQGDLQSQVATYRDLNQLLVDNDIEPNPLLIGPNWIINSSSDLSSVQSALGGTIDK